MFVPGYYVCCMTKDFFDKGQMILVESVLSNGLLSLVICYALLVCCK
jgi:hypothetical protein